MFELFINNSKGQNNNLKIKKTIYKRQNFEILFAIADSIDFIDTSYELVYNFYEKYFFNDKINQEKLNQVTYDCYYNLELSNYLFSHTSVLIAIFDKEKNLVYGINNGVFLVHKILFEKERVYDHKYLSINNNKKISIDQEDNVFVPINFFSNIDKESMVFITNIMVESYIDINFLSAAISYVYFENNMENQNGVLDMVSDLLIDNMKNNLDLSVFFALIKNS